MEFPELSLAPTQLVFNKSSSTTNSSLLESESKSSTSRKRKLFQDHHHLNTHELPSSLNTSPVDLQLKFPLPLDWEQCLDLESGKMYYLNRKTSRKSWNWPCMDQALDLELNISRFSSTISADSCSESSNTLVEEQAKNNNKHQSNNMVALACLNCHLLVILSKSSPSCPNCKYVHSFPTHHPKSQVLQHPN